MQSSVRSSVMHALLALYLIKSWMSGLSEKPFEWRFADVPIAPRFYTYRHWPEPYSIALMQPYDIVSREKATLWILHCLLNVNYHSLQIELTSHIKPHKH